MFFLVIMHSGKTNMLEAIFVCAIGKSFRTKNEKELIHLNQNELTIEIEYQKSDRDGKIKYEISDKKNIFLNGIKIKKLSELLGNIHIVLFTPDDINILKGGPAERRKFLDIMIGQLRPNYVYNLNLFLKTLEQRNSYLRQIKLENKNQDLLDIWDERLADYAQIISQYRKEFIDKISKKIDHIHQEITEGKEKLLIEYVSQCSNKEDYLKLLKQNRNLDIIKGYTTKGIHRDDFRTYINNKEVNIYGSQGQHRTAILSLKLAELNVVYDEMGEYPILLLDDFMSELDEKRRKSFLNHIKDTQVIITCTDKIKVDNLNFNLYYVENGKINFK
ncbi:MAG: DNA replication/repair protein RecF [Clostridia bacterium]